MEPGYGGGPPGAGRGAGLENLEPGLETFATDGTAYGRWQMAWLHSEARLFTKLLSLFLRGNTEVKSKRMPPGPSQTADMYMVEIWEHGISWRRRS